MKIKMLKSTPGAIEGGLKTILYKAGIIYNSEDMLPGNAQVFIKLGVAQEHVSPPEVIRHQMGITGAPENKREKVPENKEPEPEVKKPEVKKPVHKRNIRKK